MKLTHFLATATTAIIIGAGIGAVAAQPELPAFNNPTSRITTLPVPTITNTPKPTPTITNTPKPTRTPTATATARPVSDSPWDGHNPDVDDVNSAPNIEAAADETYGTPEESTRIQPNPNATSPADVCPEGTIFDRWSSTCINN